MGGVGTAETVGKRLVGEQSLEISGRNDAVRVKKDEIIALGTLHSIVSGNGTALVLFPVITHKRIAGTHVAAGCGRAIVNGNNFEASRRSLSAEAFKESLHLVGAVIDRYYDAEFHDILDL